MEKQQDERYSAAGRLPEPLVNFYTRKDEIFLLLPLALSRSLWFEDHRIDALGKKYLTVRRVLQKSWVFRIVAIV